MQVARWRTWGSVLLALLMLAACEFDLGNRNPLIGRWEAVGTVSPELSSKGLAASMEFTPTSVLVGPVAIPATYEVSGSTVVVQAGLGVGIVFRMNGPDECYIDLVVGRAIFKRA